MKNKAIFLVAILAISAVLLATAIAKPVVAEQNNDKGPLTKITFIHYKNGHAAITSKGGVKPTTTCYAFIMKGAKLKSTKALTIHPSIDTTAILNSAAEWDSHTSKALFDGYTVNSTADWDINASDGRNEFSFGNYPQAGVIAVTNIWGYFYGPAPTREITEFDIMFDTDFTWGDATTNPALMDLQNIATHEIGHGVGLADLYSIGCNLQTMYGYSNNGETIKRDLANGDITGLQKLYGA